jgi:hypothetical protein
MSAPPPPDPLDVAWAALLEQWDSEAKHKSFVGLAATLQRLPDAARRYRALVDDPARAARAKQGIDRVLSVAMSTMTPVVREKPRSINVMIPLTALAAALLVTTIVARATELHALTSPVVIVGEVIVIALLPWRRWAARDA